MNILLWIILGAIADWITDMIMASSHGLVEDIILGIIGSFVGGYIMNFFGQPGVTGFNFYSLIVSVVGAVVLIFLGRLLHR
ncbi:MAG: GlsB/YeaQ/YmgE family stress response membrane protein [Patescibacteria group bacterium]